MADTTNPLHSSFPQSLAEQRLPAAALRVLRLLLELGREDESAHVGTLAARLGVEPREAATHLLHLERAGLARADRARLTMAGLVVATRLPAVACPQPGRGPAGSSRPRARRPQHLPAGFIGLPQSASGRPA